MPFIVVSKTLKLSKLVNLRLITCEDPHKLTKMTKNYLMTYPSMLSASGGMVQESRIPLEPTASPSRLEGGPGTGREKGKCEGALSHPIVFLFLLCGQYHHSHLLDSYEE